MRRVAISALLAASVAFGTAPAAEAKTSKCRAGKYLSSVATAELKVERLRAINLPSKTDGYAPPCLVADAAAAAIQNQGREYLPKTITLYGVRWFGGKWNCTYEGDGQANDQSGICRKAGKPSRKITMDLSDRTR